MSDPLVRLLLIAVVVAVAVGVGLLARRRLVTHPAVDISGVGFEPGLVVFTSTACHRCKKVLAAARATGAPLREVTYELEAGLQEKVGVTGVPLTLVVDGSGRLNSQIAGQAGEQRLRRAIRKAGL